MSHGATARLFVAVDPPATVRERLAEWARATDVGLRASGGARGALRLLDADLLHLTMCFLGSRPAQEIDALADALERAVTGGSSVSLSPADARQGQLDSIALALGAPLWLPSRRPRALAVEVLDGDGGLLALQRRIVRALRAASAWEPERRRFRAHITLARVRGGSLRARGARASEPPLPATPALRFEPASVSLYRSWLASDGASYEALATFQPVGSHSELASPSEDASQLASSPSASSPAGQKDRLPSSHSASSSAASPPPEAGHTRLLPSRERVGSAPSSHSGSEPSSQENEPSAERVGELPSSQ